jgi:hypothetical protein
LPTVGAGVSNEAAPRRYREAAQHERGFSVSEKNSPLDIAVHRIAADIAPTSDNPRVQVAAEMHNAATNAENAAAAMAARPGTPRAAQFILCQECGETREQGRMACGALIPICVVCKAEADDAEANRMSILAKAMDRVFAPFSSADARIAAEIAQQKRTEAADANRYGFGKRPGSPVFRGSQACLAPVERAQAWARTEYCELDIDSPNAEALGAHIEAIGAAMRTGVLPDWVELSSRRSSCCGATFRMERDDAGTTYVCPLCGEVGQ